MDDLLNAFMQLIRLMSNIGNILITGIKYIITTGINIAISFVNTVVEFVFQTTGFLSSLSRILPLHFYSFVVVCTTAIVIRAIVRKVVS